MKLDQIVAVGSVDGILTSAALLRLCEGNPGLTFCQAFTVDKIDISGWAPGSQIAFVDLAVNNRDPKMTENFVRKITNAGHKIVAIIDEHSAVDWADCLVSCELRFDDLLIQPMTQKVQTGVFGRVVSSGDVLMSHFANHDPHDQLTWLLAFGARCADFGEFQSSQYTSVVNKAIKSAIHDDSRRVVLAYNAAKGKLFTDPQIQTWVNEYEEIEFNHKTILSAAKIERGIVCVDAAGKRVDMTSLMMELYKMAPIAAVKGEMFDSLTKSKGLLVSFGVPQSSGRDIFTEVKNAGITPHGGFAQKVNVLPEDYERATRILASK